MKFDNKFDEIIKKVCSDLAVPFSWLIIKAQSFAESGILVGDTMINDVKATSHTGALGIMQLMPENCKDIDPFNPEQNIRRGVEIDMNMYNIFKKESGLERIKFMLAAYNAGPKWIIEAQTDALWHGKRPDLWINVYPFLRFHTGDSNADQTINYVSKILQYYVELLDGNDKKD